MFHIIIFIKELFYYKNRLIINFLRFNNSEATAQCKVTVRYITVPDKVKLYMVTKRQITVGVNHQKTFEKTKLN